MENFNKTERLYKISCTLLYLCKRRRGGEKDKQKTWKIGRVEERKRGREEERKREREEEEEEN